MRSNQRRKIAGIAAGTALAGLILAGCGGSKSVEARSGAPEGGAQAPLIQVARAESRAVMASVQVTGSFVAKESSDVAPQAGGRVTDTPVDVGAFVKEGEIIARLDDRDAKLRLDTAVASEQQAEAALRQAQSRIGLGQNDQFDASKVPEVLSAKAAYDSAVAQAKLSEADAKRYENLIKSGDVSESAYEKARTQADTAEAQANSARQQYEATANAARQNFQGVMTAQASLVGMRAQTALARKAVEDALVRAPFAGYVSARPIAVGQYVATNSKIATVLRITPIKLELQVAEANSSQMRIGAPVETTVPGYPDRKFLGTVTAINPAVDLSSRTFTVVAEFTNGDLALKPGMFATARILLRGSSMGVFIPSKAIVTDPSTNSSQLFFIKDNKARVAVVQIGETDGTMTRVLSGLDAGMTVALDHQADLYDGQSVRISNGSLLNSVGENQSGGKGNQ